MVRKKNMNIQATLEQLWTPWIMSTVVHKMILDDNGRDCAQKMVVVNFYRPPNDYVNSIQHLKFLLTSLKIQHQTSCILVQGD